MEQASGSPAEKEPHRSFQRQQRVLWTCVSHQAKGNRTVSVLTRSARRRKSFVAQEVRRKLVHQELIAAGTSPFRGCFRGEHADHVTAGLLVKTMRTRIQSATYCSVAEQAAIAEKTNGGHFGVPSLSSARAWWWWLKTENGTVGKSYDWRVFFAASGGLLPVTSSFSIRSSSLF